MGNYIRSFWLLGNEFGFEFLFFCIIIAAIVAFVVTAGVFGVFMLIGKEDTKDVIPGTFVTVGLLTFFILLLTGC